MFMMAFVSVQDLSSKIMPAGYIRLDSQHFPHLVYFEQMVRFRELHEW